MPPQHAEICPLHTTNKKVAERVLAHKAAAASKALKGAFGPSDQSAFLKHLGLPEPGALKDSLLVAPRGPDILGGAFKDCPEELHNQMLLHAAKGDLPLSTPGQGAKLMLHKG